LADVVAAGSSAVVGDSPAVSDTLALVWAPPLLCTIPVRGSDVSDESANGWPSSSSLDDVDVAIVDVTFGSDGVVDPEELAELADALLLSADADAEELDESDDDELDDAPASDGSARATPGIVATADPTPSATANAPTRPTYLT